jgi:hypothetical protein
MYTGRYSILLLRFINQSICLFTIRKMDSNAMILRIFLNEAAANSLAAENGQTRHWRLSI